jgi:hypothetical protein
MDEMLTKINSYIDEQLALLKAEIEEYEQRYEEDFNPMDWSGGNFDDAYYMGIEEGKVYGEFAALSKIKQMLEGKEESK